MIFSRRNVISLATSIASLAGIFHFWRTGHTSLAPALATLQLSLSILYKKLITREKIEAKNVIVITGCDTGLGYSLAIHCKKILGATVVAGVLAEDGQGAADLKELGLKVIPLDVTNVKSVQAFAEEIKQVFSSDKKFRLHAFVNNAGVMIFGEFEWQLIEQYQIQLNVNVLGTMMITRELLPLIRQDKSRIINVISHCALASLPGLSVYGATKGALKAWNDSLRVELRKYGVKVVAFVPGSFIGESNLMAKQKSHFQIMRSNMSEEAYKFYGRYFESYAQYLAPLSADKNPQSLQNLDIYEIFDGALLDTYPWSMYKCEPFRYTFYHTLFRITPTFMRDCLVERFVSMPKWSNKN